jgi:hypothetical protein
LPVEDSFENPFAASYTSEAAAAVSDDSHCVQTRLQLDSPVVRRSVLIGFLELKNVCTFPMALLTAPVELRLKLTPQTRFPFEAGGLSQAYALAYIYRKEFGFESHETFLGDGGLSVSTLPDYAVIAPDSILRVGLSSGEALDVEAGHYGLVLMTIAVKAPGRPEKVGTIEFSENVRKMESSRARSIELVLPKRAIRLSSRAFFEVVDQSKP